MVNLRKLMNRSVLALAVLTAGSAFAASPTPAVTSVIPANAAGALVINNLKDLSTKVSNMAVRLNIAKRYGMPVPPDLASYVAHIVGVTQGLDTSGSAAVVVMKPAGEHPAWSDFKDSFILLLPTTDADTFMSGFTPGTPDSQGIREITLSTGAKGFAVVVDKKWVAIQGSREPLELYLKRTGPTLDQSAAVIKAIDDNDLTLWANVKTLFSMSSQSPDDLEAAMLTQFANSTNGDTYSRALQVEFLRVYFDSLFSIAKDSTDAFVTVRLGDAGLTAGFGGVLTDGSTTQKTLAGLFQKPAPALTGLPAEDFLIAGSASIDGPSFAALINRISDQLTTNPDIAGDPRSAALKQTLGTARDLVAGVHGIRGIFGTGAADASHGIMSGVYLMDTDDPQKYIDTSLKMYSDPAAMQSVATNGLKITPSATRDALTVNGVKLSRFQMKMEVDPAGAPNAAAAEASQQMIKLMYGPDGITMYIGAIGKQVFFSLAADEAELAKQVAAAQSQSTALLDAENVKILQPQILPNASVVGYLSIGKYLQLIGQVAAATPMGGMIQPLLTGAEKAPPMIFSVAYDKNVIREEAHYPVATINAVLDVVDNFRHMIQGMQGGAGNAPPPNVP